MPYIDVSISKKLMDEEKDSLKSKLGELITIIPGKTEKVLMVGINDGYTMYFSGEKKENIAFINVKLFKESGFEYKAEFSKKVFELFQTEYGIPSDSIFMNFDEYNSWASRGELKK